MPNTIYLERCFLPLDCRAPHTSAFFRVIGLDSNGTLLSQLKKFYAQARESGVCLKGISNPTEAEIERFFSSVAAFSDLNPDLIARHITVWLGQVKPAQRALLSSAVWGTLELLRRQGANPGVMKNAYVKYMCWLRASLGHVLAQLGRPMPIKVLFEGDIAKHEVLFLHLLHQAGCDVVYVHYTSPQSYLKADPGGLFSELISGAVLAAQPSGLLAGAAAPPGAPRAPAKAAPAPLAPAPWKGMEHTVELNTWLGDRPAWEAVLLPNAQRTGGAPGKLPCLLAACYGGDNREEYRNRLFHLKQGLDTAGKKWILMLDPPPAPTAAETAPYLSVDKTLARERLLRALADRMSLNVGRVQSLLAQQAFYEVMISGSESDPVRTYNHGVRLACWLKRYGDMLFDGYRAEVQPAIVFYGPMKDAEIALFGALAQMGVDVLCFIPMLEEQGKLFTHHLAPLWAKVLFNGSLPLEPFPQREEKLRPSTTAYNASRELDQLLYTDTAIFRDRQFTRSQPVTLKTTYDEVGQLWKEQAQFRPSFEARDGVVHVPNLFSKICGVDHGDLELYWNHIREMVTDNTFLADSVPFLTVQGPAMSAPQAKSFLHDGKLDPKALKASSHYRYDYLPDDMQDYILEKIQALIDYDLIINAGPDLSASVLSVLMNLDKELLRMLQSFDFTKDIPKFIVVDLKETLFSLEECILLAFLNLVGFDIAIFTPTGYRNLEKYIRPDSYDTLIAGEYQFDLQAPNLRDRKGRTGGDFFSRWFSGGKRS